MFTYHVFHLEEYDFPDREEAPNFVKDFPRPLDLRQYQSTKEHIPHLVVPRRNLKVLTTLLTVLLPAFAVTGAVSAAAHYRIPLLSFLQLLSGNRSPTVPSRQQAV